jgi:hypothetical protein
MKQIPITIEGKDYQLFYANIEGQLLTRLEMTSEENPPSEKLPEGEVVSNLIFGTMLFRNEEDLWELKKILRKAVKEYLQSGQKNRLYCLYAALWSVPGVLAKKDAVDFVRQLNVWFADDFPKEGTVEFVRICDNLRKEASSWGGWKTPIKVNEWKSYALKRGEMRESKISQFVSVAMATFVPLNGLAKKLRKKSFRSFR